MQLQERIQAFGELGKVFRRFADGDTDQENGQNLLILGKAVADASIQNPWFTKENINLAISSFGKILKKDLLESWLEPYGLSDQPARIRTFGLIPAGNIPLVGFHDMLCVLITGHKCLVKHSEKDKVLPEAVGKILLSIEPEFSKHLVFTGVSLKDYDAVIATGSNNTSRYFEYYFGKYPHIIRKNRNSVAILTGRESREELQLLAGDIFGYFGLGCRNVSLLYLPEGYDIPNLISAFHQYGDIVNHHKYANNYEYNKAIFLVNRVPHYDSGFVLLKEDEKLASPLAVIHFQYYKDLESLQRQLKAQQDLIQCIVSGMDIPAHVPFGHTQTPQLWDYADGVDTIRFLKDL